METFMSKEIILKVHYVKMHMTKETEFKIQIVPNRFTVDYSDYVGKLNKVIKLGEQRKTAEGEELDKIEDKLTALGLQDILELKYSLIKSVLIANDYEFNATWWDTKVDPADVDNFIVQCAAKDVNPKAKKKAVKRKAN